MRRPLDQAVVLPALGLLVIGLLFVHSTVGAEMVMRQLLFAGCGALIVALLLRGGGSMLAELSYPFYGALLLLLVALPAVADNSATSADRWISVGMGFNVQPSEFMKIGFVLALARHLRHRGVTNTWSSYLVPFALTAAPWFLVMRQPDLGSSLVLLPVLLAMVTVSGARGRHVLLLATGAALLLPAAYFVPGVLQPYQKDRLDAFLRPIPSLVAEARDLREQREHAAARELEREISQLKRGTGYQQFYSVVAIGSGGLFGQGLGEGLQNRGNRVPVRYSDFIFAIVGEEWGLAGTTTVMALYVLLVLGVLGVAHRTREPYGRLVCVGVGAMIGGQALMNLAIVSGLLPVTGLPLPLVSYGGSSLLTTAVALGCVLDVSRRQTPVFFES